MKHTIAAFPSVVQAKARAVLPGQADHAVERGGKYFAGVHLIVDMWEPKHIGDLGHVEAALRRSAQAARATLLHVHLHRFARNGGVSGVAVLAESHISVHTWPERAFAAFDIFTCGDTDPEAGAAALTAAFEPERVNIREILRGGGE